ncbi:hypothetical protein E2562_017044 [Oryza meyeriana var. granulata]|uniref:PARP catalytic domain-containing protein n=1 Tax=Oryza meyeriana var. granulata TaxID=110450 RepID=A0A6G1F8J1_9ORYZ|nr:hypothetical protein E2562_017044 [Oryza meyeriana var. granulata]
MRCSPAAEVAEAAACPPLHRPGRCSPAAEAVAPSLRSPRPLLAHHRGRCSPAAEAVAPPPRRASCPRSTRAASPTATSCCRIIRHGFSAKEGKAGIGVFTTSTSGRAYESIEASGGGGDDPAGTRKALLVCRVIAGRVHKPLENLKEFTG